MTRFCNPIQHCAEVVASSFFCWFLVICLSRLRVCHELVSFGRCKDQSAVCVQSAVTVQSIGILPNHSESIWALHRLPMWRCYDQCIKILHRARCLHWEGIEKTDLPILTSWTDIYQPIQPHNLRTTWAEKTLKHRGVDGRMPISWSSMASGRCDDSIMRKLSRNWTFQRMNFQTISFEYRASWNASCGEGLIAIASERTRPNRLWQVIHHRHMRYLATIPPHFLSSGWTKR